MNAQKNAWLCVVTALFCIVLLALAAVPMNAQDNPPAPAQAPTAEQPKSWAQIPHRGELTVKVEKDPIKDTLLAIAQDEAGTTRTHIIKNADEITWGSEEDKNKPWNPVSTVGKKPWGPPVKSFEEIRKNPNILNMIDNGTDIDPLVKEALKKAIKENEWFTVRLGDFPFLEKYWGHNWVKDKVMLTLDKKLQDLPAYITFVKETGRFYEFNSYCQNLAIPYVGLRYEIATIPAVPPEPAKPKILPAVCDRVVQTPETTGALHKGDIREYQAFFKNPSGLSLTVSWDVINLATKETRKMSSSTDGNFRIKGDWFEVGHYLIHPRANYNDQSVDTSACAALLIVEEEMPPAKFTDRTPPTTTVTKKSKKWWIIPLAVGGAAVGIYAATRGSHSDPPTTGDKTWRPGNISSASARGGLQIRFNFRR